MRSTVNRLLFFFLVLFCFRCSDSVQQLSKGTNKAPLSGVIRKVLLDSLGNLPEELQMRCALQEFYSWRNYQPVWIRKEALSAQGDSVMRMISRAPYFGLLTEDYHPRIIDSLFRYFNGREERVTQLGQLDLYLSDALFSMAKHIRDGRIDPTRLSWSGDTDVDTALYQSLAEGIARNNLTEILQQLEPAGMEFTLLKKDLRVKLDSVFNGVNDRARVDFLEKRIRTLSINMERWRWEHRDDSARLLTINIPAFQMEIRNQDSVEFASAVVVGTPWSPTPELDATLVNFILYPTWNVPRSIATRELLPKIKGHPAYLTNHGYKVFAMDGSELSPDSVFWDALHVNNFPYLLQQQSGAFNALGIVKFTFTNDLNIYLHDTNAKRLFAYPDRALSHGCIRVERALDLAHFLVNDQNPYCNRRELRLFISEGTQRQVNFPPLALKIRYYTASQGPFRSIVFHKDIYGKDALLSEAIYCRHPERRLGMLAVNSVEQPGEADTCL